MDHWQRLTIVSNPKKNVLEPRFIEYYLTSTVHWQYKKYKEGRVCYINGLLSTKMSYLTRQKRGECFAVHKAMSSKRLDQTLFILCSLTRRHYFSIFEINLNSYFGCKIWNNSGSFWDTEMANHFFESFNKCEGLGVAFLRWRKSAKTALYT